MTTSTCQYKIQTPPFIDLPTQTTTLSWDSNQPLFINTVQGGINKAAST